MSHPKAQSISALLRAEAKRFEDLAKDMALVLVRKRFENGGGFSERDLLSVHDHDLRRDTYLAAANLLEAP